MPEPTPTAPPRAAPAWRSLALRLAGTVAIVASSALFHPAAGADDAAVSEPVLVPTVTIGPDLRAPLLDLPEPLRDALRRGRWDAAVALIEDLDRAEIRGRRKGTFAFVHAWALVHAGRAEEAAPLLDLARGGDGVPPAWLDLVRGEVRHATEDDAAAIEPLSRIGEDSALWPRAQVVRAEVLRELGRTKEAYEVYERLAGRSDPYPGTPEALLALAQRAGPGSDAAYLHLRRIWAAYPKSEPSRLGWTALEAYGRNPTWQERATRAYALMRMGDWDAVISETSDLQPPAGDGSDAACKLLFAKGRSQYKKNRLSASIAAFGDIGTRCPAASDDWGARGLYLQGTAHFRRGQHASAARAFARIPELYPQSTYADDGWLHAGIALQEAGDLAGARERWRRALDEIADGDTTPESTWRLAWTLYLDGQPEEAVVVAERLGRLPLTSDRRHVEAGRYWAARWRLYPDVDQPDVATEHDGARDEAIAGWRQLCEDLPHSYYSVLGYSRLVEVAPEVAAALSRRPAGHDRGDLSVPWVVRLTLMEDPDVRAGIDLARMGLVGEARAAWDHAEVSAGWPDEVAYLTELRIGGGDWLLAHDDMRRWMIHHPPGTLGAHEPQVLRIAYPDRYWPEVAAAAKPYRYEARLLHGLVREESNFNKDIRSFAGAIGLSQVMPPTAKQVAGWLKRPVGDLRDPANNLALGAKYLDVVHNQLGDSPFLSLAGYNAGPHRVETWVGQWGNVPTDEFVERIPFRETRGYVRRVTTTWQTYRYQFDDGPAFPDMSRFNHQAIPGR